MPRKAITLDKPKDLEVTGNGYHGFRSRREYAWFRDYWARRGICIERPLATLTPNPPPFYLDVLRRRDGWYHHFILRFTCNCTLAREFSASLIRIARYEYRAYVRGVQVILTPSTLSALTRIPEMAQYQCPFRGGSPAPTPTAVATEITGRPYQWDGNTMIQKSELSADYTMLWLVLCNCIIPTSYNASINLWAGRILYAIGTGMQVDVLRLLIEAISEPLETSSRYIKSGVLITRLCRAAGVVERNNDERKPARMPVGEQTQHRSTGQGRQKRRAGEASSSRPQDSEDEFTEMEDEPPVPDPIPAGPPQDQMFTMLREITESIRRLEATQARTDERLTSLDAYVRRALPAPTSDEGDDDDSGADYGYGSDSEED